MSTEERLEIFDSFLEELRQQICEKNVASEEQLEQLISTVFIIGINELQTDDINSMLNAILNYVKEHTDKFPSLTLFDYVKRFLELLQRRRADAKQEVQFFVSLAWPNDLRIIVQRLLRTFRIPEQYVEYSFELSALACQVVGAAWLRADAQFAALLASLTGGRLRILIENADEIKLEQLALCLSLLEDVMQCVEDDDETKEIDDTAATSIGKSSQEAATFLCECVVELAKRFGAEVQGMDVLLLAARFLYAFFHIGGWKIVNKELLADALPVLIRTRDNPKSADAPYISVFEEVLREITTVQ